MILLTVKLEIIMGIWRYYIIMRKIILGSGLLMIAAIYCLSAATIWTGREVKREISRINKAHKAK